MTPPVSNGAPLKLHGGWKKAKRSGSGGDACVELKDLQQGFAIRDSKNPAGSFLVFNKNGLMQLTQFAKEN